MKLSHIVEYLKRDTGGRDPLVVDYGNLDDLNANDHRRVFLFGADGNGNVFGIEAESKSHDDILTFVVRESSPGREVISYPYESFLLNTNQDHRKGFKIAESRIKTMSQSRITPDELVLAQTAHSYYVDNIKGKHAEAQSAALNRYQLSRRIVRGLSEDLSYDQARKLQEALTDCPLDEFDANLNRIIEALNKLARSRADIQKESN